MEHPAYKIITTDGQEIDLQTFEFAKKIALLTYDSEKVDFARVPGIGQIISDLQANQGALGVYLLDSRFDLATIDEKEMGMNPEFARKFMDKLCEKSGRLRHNQVPTKNEQLQSEKIKELQNFHDHFALERMEIYTKPATACFICGVLITVFFFLAWNNSAWNWIAVGVFTSAFYGLIKKIKKGEYEQEASEKTGQKIKGRSYNPNDYV